LPEDFIEMSNGDYVILQSEEYNGQNECYYDTGIIKDGKSVLVLINIVLDATGNILSMPLYEQGKFYKRV
jgi:hypothetical protein